MKPVNQLNFTPTGSGPERTDHSTSECHVFFFRHENCRRLRDRVSSQLPVTLQPPARFSKPSPEHGTGLATHDNAALATECGAVDVSRKYRPHSSCRAVFPAHPASPPQSSDQRGPKARCKASCYIKELFSKNEHVELPLSTKMDCPSPANI
ncbi:hypothetical protein Bbelb_170020 [Branchiostoma belcheri]|nr:hypothetical protein Bbelb_170020 [Branchiostoma belcheri]